MNGIQYGNTLGSFGHHIGAMMNLHSRHNSNSKLGPATTSNTLAGMNPVRQAIKESVNILNSKKH